VEGALVGGLIAQVEGEAFFVDGAVVMETVRLQQLGAIAQPVLDEGSERGKIHPDIWVVSRSTAGLDIIEILRIE
jgi:hypothetical protein